MHWLKQLFSTTGFEPHGYCFLWNGRLVTLHVGSDLIIGLSYWAIAVTLVYLLYRARETVPFSRLILAFGIFILACGSTHFVEILTLWVPVYWFAGALKAVTAAASVSTAIMLPTLVPRVLDTLRAARAEAAATAALHQSEAEFRGTFEHSGIGFAIVGLDGGWLQVNSALTRITGYSADELRALTFQDITHPEDLHADLEHLRALLAGKVACYEMEKRYFRKDGATVHVLLTVSLVRDGTAAPVHFVAQIQDLTERRVSEERLRHAAKMEAVATLASGIAHDFNNLLTVVKGGADFILTAPEASASVRADATAIRTASERAQSLTRELLTFARRQVRDVRLIGVGAFLHTATPLLLRLLSTHQRLTIRESSDDAFFLADENELQLALLNLVANARDAIPDGGVVTVSYALVNLHTAAHASPAVGPGLYVRLVVEDTGEGLSDEAHAHLFEPFFSTKPTGKGSGLGLATVYGVVQAIGGTVTYERASGGGARFILWIPAAAERDDDHLTPATSGGKFVNDLHAPLAVVVDDEEGVLMVVARVLRHEGFTVITTTDSREALALLEAHPEADILVTDFVMPGMNGKELLEAVAARFPDVRRLLMSGYTPDSETRHTLASTGTAFIAKPFDVAALVATVRAVLGTELASCKTAESHVPA